MDVLLNVFDTYCFDKIYAKALPSSHMGNCSSIQNVPYTWGPDAMLEPSELKNSCNVHTSWWPRENIYRQSISLLVVTLIFAYILYFGTALFSWFFLFDRTSLQNPKYRKDQIRLEIGESLISIPILSLMHIPIFVLQAQGYSKLYDGTGGGPGLWYDILQFPLFMVVTETIYYWIHRALHTPLLYKTLHKQHHKWVVPTPFSGFAFHPLDGFIQGLPYTIFIFIFPLNKWAYFAFFTFINMWSTLIHDGEYASDSRYINGAACHTVHHQRFSHNFGQLFTLWDRIAGTYRNPGEDLDLPPQKLAQAVPKSGEKLHKKTQ